MKDLTDFQADKLERAHAIFARADGVAKVRLLAALAADVPPVLSQSCKSRYEHMKRYASRAAVAAALLLTFAVAWNLNEPKTLFAQVAKAMSRARGFRCDFVEVTPGYAGAENAKLGGQVYWSSSGEERTDFFHDDKPESTIIFRPGSTGLWLEPTAKRYRIMPKSSAREFSFGMFARLGEFKGKAEPIAGLKEIRGVRAEGFSVPWALVVGDDTHASAKIEVWLDPATTLPVRVNLSNIGPPGAPVMRLENFQWGTQEPGLFDVAIPAGYTKMPTNDFKADQITEFVAYGLRIFAKYNNGKYPAVTYVYGDEQGAALRKLMGMSNEAQGFVRPDKNLKWANPKDEEFAYGSHGLSWINSIQRDFSEGVYNGKTVTPQDATRVLVRWRLDDGDYRVIFGDLKSATVSAEKLKELESR
jgi:outer membrane lipoprotein-sorting protein